MIWIFQRRTKKRTQFIDILYQIFYWSIQLTAFERTNFFGDLNSLEISIHWGSSMYSDDYRFLVNKWMDAWVKRKKNVARITKKHFVSNLILESEVIVMTFQIYAQHDYNTCYLMTQIENTHGIQPNNSLAINLYFDASIIRRGLNKSIVDVLQHTNESNPKLFGLEEKKNAIRWPLRDFPRDQNKLHKKLANFVK